MLDKVILRLKEEVAMDGNQGTSVNDMWIYIQRFLSEETNKLNNDDTNTKKIEPTMDSRYKSFFWRYFQHIPELSFFVGKEDTDADTEDNPQEAASNPPDDGEYEEEDLDNEVEPDLIEGITELEYDLIESRYGSRLRVVADKDLQEAQLFVDIPIGQTWSSHLRNYLTSILQAREAGITQFELTKKWKTDPRSSGHFAKSLEAKGAIQRLMVTYKGMRTNLCIHARFKHRDQAQGAADDSKPHNANMLGVIFTKQVFRDRLIALLTDAMDNVMFSFDILAAMGFDLNNVKTRRWYNRAIDRLCHEGFIRKLTSQRNNTGQRHRCIQLMNSNSNLLDTQKYADDDENMPTDTAHDDLDPFIMVSRNGLDSTSKFLHTMSLDKQVLQAIQDAGDQGITNRDIAIAVRCDNSRMTSRALDRLAEIKGDARFKYGIERALEFEGRNRRYRFYAYANYVKMKESEPMDVPVIDPFAINESALKETNYQSMKSGKTKKTAAKTLSTSDKDYTSARHPDAVIPRMFLCQAHPTGKQVALDSSDESEEPAPPKKKRGRPPKYAPKPKPTPSNTNNITTSEPNTDTSLSSYNTNNDVNVNNPPTNDTAHQPTLPLDSSIPSSDTQPADSQDLSSSTTSQQVEPTTPQQVESTTPQQAKTTTSQQTDSATLPAGPSSRKRLQSDSEEKGTPKKRPNTIMGYFKTISRKEMVASDTSRAATETSPQPALSPSAAPTPSVVTSMETTNTASSSAALTTPMDSPAAAATDSSASTDIPSATSTETAPSTTIGSTLSTPTAITAPAKPSTHNTPMTKFSHKNKPLQINKYSEERKQIILAMLEDTHIIERGIHLKNLFANKRTELFGDTGNNSHMIDIKTLWRSVEALKNEGLIHLYEGHILLLNGNKKKKQVLVHISLDPNGSEVANYFEYMNERKMLQPGATKMEIIEKSDVAVENLDDRLIRMQESKDQAMAAGKMSEANRLEAEIQLIKGNKTLSGEPFELKPKKVGNWILTGMAYGYINAFMVRVKMLHQYLLGLLLSGSGVEEGVDLEKRLLPTTAIIHHMPLSLFCIIIGIFTPTNEFREYMKDETHGAVLLMDLPDSIRGCAFNQRNRAIYRLRLLLRSLVHLGVIEIADLPTTDGKPDNNNTARGPPQLSLLYKLPNKTAIKNYRLPGHPIIQEHSLLDQAQVMLYWSELQYVCTKTSLADDESTALITDEVGYGDQECLRTLYTVRNWAHNILFTRKQKEMMDEYVDKEALTTPYNSYAWCRSIASEVGVPMDGVRYYYRKVEEAMGRRSKATKLKKERIQESQQMDIIEGPQRQRQRRRRRRRQRIDDGIVSENSRVITQATTSPFKYRRTCIPQAERLAMEQRSLQLHVDDQGQPIDVDSFLDDYSNVPLVTQDDLATKLIKTRSKRSVWTIEEDDLLKLCYVIMNHRRENGCRFLWKPIGQLLGRFTIAQCRKRFSIIRDNPRHAEDLQNIRIRWHRYYNQGLQDKDLTDWKVVNDNDFDITSYVTYYLRLCQTDEELDAPSNYIYLPTNSQIIDHNFDINSITALNHQGDGFFEDVYHQKISTIAMRQALCLHAFTQRINSMETYDCMPIQNIPDLNTNRRIIELLKHLFKMILMTPAEVYDPFYANSVLSSYPEELLKIALAESRHAGVLIHAKGDRIGDRRIPKTILGVSEKFMRNMTVQLPENIMLQASKYEEHLTETTHITLDPVQLTSGMMLCIVDLFSVGKISIEMENVKGFIDKFSTPSHSARRINENNQNYCISVTIKESRPISAQGKTIEHEIIALAEDQIGPILEQLHDVLDNQMSALLQSVVAFLRSRGNTGATVLELKQALLDDENIGDFSDDLLTSVVDTITVNADPPLAVFVGYATPRLVLTTELPTWAILPKTIPSTYLDGRKRRKTINPMPKSTPIPATSVDKDQHTAAESTQETKPEVNQMDSEYSTPIFSSQVDDDMLRTVKLENVSKENQSTSVDSPVIATSDQSSTGTTKRSRPEDFATVNNERQNELAQQRLQVVMPRLWIDINGHVTESIWRGCIKLLVEAIMRKPGITYGHLCRTMNTTLSPMEIKDLLNDLLRLGVLRQLAVSTGKSPVSRSGLFKSKHTTHTVSLNTIDPGVQTSYWLLPGHYKKLSM